mgnify:CR=1 FL=1
MRDEIAVPLKQISKIANVDKRNGAILAPSIFLPLFAGLGLPLDNVQVHAQLRFCGSKH